MAIAATKVAVDIAAAQRLYAHWVETGTQIGLAVLVATFLAYALGLAAPYVSLDELPRLWNLPVDRYLAATGAPGGWGWLGHVDRIDYMSYVGIILLALLSLLSYVRLLSALLASGEWLYAAMAAAQLLVLSLSAFAP